MARGIESSGTGALYRTARNLSRQLSADNYALPQTFREILCNDAENAGLPHLDDCVQLTNGPPFPFSLAWGELVFLPSLCQLCCSLVMTGTDKTFHRSLIGGRRSHSVNRESLRSSNRRLMVRAWVHRAWVQLVLIVLLTHSTLNRNGVDVVCEPLRAPSRALRLIRIVKTQRTPGTRKRTHRKTKPSTRKC